MRESEKRLLDEFGEVIAHINDSFMMPAKYHGTLSQVWIKLDQFLKRPKIVCLCGSTRFYDQFMRSNYEETMAGNIVLSVGFYPHAQKEIHHEERGCTKEEKTALDELHKRKIDLADEVLVLNVEGYIGESTKSEIEYARARGIPVRFLNAALTKKKKV